MVGLGQLPNAGGGWRAGLNEVGAWFGMAGALGLRKGQKIEKPGGVVPRSGVAREWSRGGVREERRALPCPLLVTDCCIGNLLLCCVCSGFGCCWVSFGCWC